MNKSLDNVSMSAELSVEYWPITRPIPSARNARTHSKSQIAEIAGSISAFGFANPILVDDRDEIVAGHGRYGAAQLLGLKRVPVIVLRGLSDTQRRQLMLADNRIAMNAGWNAELLKLEIQDLRSLSVDLTLLGFSDNELARALGAEVEGGLTDEDVIPDAAERPVSRPGDL